MQITKKVYPEELTLKEMAAALGLGALASIIISSFGSSAPNLMSPAGESTVISSPHGHLHFLNALYGFHLV